MKRIKYFSYHGWSDTTKLRKNSPAADTKIDYIIEMLNSIGYGVDHVSPALSGNGKYQSGFTITKNNNTFRWFASLPVENRFCGKLALCFMRLQFLIWCLFNVNRNEQVLVYHSLGYDSTFLWLKKLKKIRIIGDIEEIYQDVHLSNKRTCKNEYKFIATCDKLMYPNTILNERLNPKNRPSLVIHGIYRINQIITEGFKDGKIHILYSGTYDPVKGGAIASLKAARHLTDKYHLHITGFGTATEEENVKKEFKTACTYAKCQMTYHGFLNDDEFTKLMQSCHIGLCTQDPNSKLNLTSFPSKILNYMSNGLVVLTGRNRAIEESAISDNVFYYEEQTPEEMAKAIMRIDNFDSSRIRQKLNELNENLKIQMKNFIEL